MCEYKNQVLLIYLIFLWVVILQIYLFLNRKYLKIKEKLEGILTN